MGYATDHGFAVLGVTQYTIGGIGMFYKIQSVIPEEDFILQVQFTDGVEKRYDMKP